jgi:RNA polymerase sigma-70 factor (ECF subfamily)
MPADDDPPLAPLFGAAPDGAAGATPAELEAALRDALGDARRAWPELAVPPADFVRYLAATLTPPQRGAPALRALHAADLYLACACARRDPRAIAAFEARYFPEIDRALARMKLAPPAADDVKGALRERLLFPREGERSPLASYSGRGSLGAWLRLVTVRAALKALRTSKDAAGDPEDIDVAVPGGDPELAYLKAAFAAEFKATLAQAIEALSVRERNLLRQSILDGLTIDQLGTLYRVHRATAARWIADVRTKVLDEVRARLMTRLKLDADELESVMRLARSQLDVSVHRLLLPKKRKGPGHPRK